MSSSLGQIRVRRALLSVYDKTGIVELAKSLAGNGIEIVSTGSTAKLIADSGVAVTPVEEVTGFPECLEGRVKTLHPAIHAGILADQRKTDHQDQLAELGIAAFELVVVNLYPFAQTVASGASPDEVVEQIDIGGPSMVRGAAKNHHSVAVVTNVQSYETVVQAVARGGFTLEERKQLAAEAFATTAQYDLAVAEWFTRSYAPDEVAMDSGFGVIMGGQWTREEVLRYGENPHQQAALYLNDGDTGLAHAKQLHGKAMSYNNYVDAEAAVRAAFDFETPAVAVIKHANPCGIATGASIAEAHAKAHATDPLSAFGGVIAANAEIDEAAAEQISEVFTEVVVAPGFSETALEILTQKKNIRLMQLSPERRSGMELRPISGGMLVQARDTIAASGDDPENWQLACGDAVDAQTLADLNFAWRACRSVKSNAILLARDQAAVGIGMGQVNRVDSARLAVERAGADRARGSVAASDAFFPFADGLQVLLDAGITAVVQPGGSVRDEEVIAAANEAGITMYFTGTRHFFH